MTSPRSLTLKEISFFFFPLLLNVQLMSVSHSVINAALARQEDFVAALASFSVAMVVHLFFASPSYQNHTVTIAMVRGRRSLKGVIAFVLLVASVVSLALGTIAYTPVGPWLLTRVLGIRAEIVPDALEVIGFLALLPFFTGFRGLCQGLVIRARRTSLVSLATGVRIGALFGFLALGSRFLSGAAIGAFGLLACVITETLLMVFFAWRCGLTPTEIPQEERGLGEILRYAFPLAYSSCLQQTVPLLISAIISRMPDGTLALAAFGLIRGFLFLLAGPMRNLQQAYLTLVRKEADYRALVTFFYRTSLGMALVTALIAFPLNGLLLGKIMGVDPSLRKYIAWPLAVCALFPLFYGASNLLRGYFAGAHETARLGRSTLYKLLYMLVWWLAASLLALPVPGIGLGIFLLLSAELVEAGYLRRQRDRHLQGSGRLAPQ